MPTPPPQPLPDWEANLFVRLQIFVDQWKHYGGTERSGAQPFLQKLLEIYDVTVKPGTVFEQHPVKVPAGGHGTGAQTTMFGEPAAPKYTTELMDMYLPKVCVWEMKSPTETDLQKHHKQVLGYWARMRPRYMILCNFFEFWIYDTNDEYGQLQPKLKLKLNDLPGRGDALAFLRGEEPDLEARAERVTEVVARMMGHLVRDLLAASSDPAKDRERVTKFVLQCVFAMFAEDTDLIPRSMFTEAVRQARDSGRMEPIYTLFGDLGRRAVADKTHRFAPYVNGPLFDFNQPKIELTPAQIHDLYTAARDFDWQDVRAEIFGSIFEQALDAVDRHELGAHFTREADIAKVIMPTLIEPLRAKISRLWTTKDAEQAIADMKALHILDPACGCGNFLYVVYREMKRLESALADQWMAIQRHVAKRKTDIKPPPPRPWFTLKQIHGIECESFAAFLARVVLWIGEHLANRELGLDEEMLPLKNLDENVKCADALLVPWPRPEGELAIVGNPPYLGVRKMRRELSDEYVELIFERYPKNRAADLVTYWFTRSLEVLRPGERAGFVCTNSVAQNESREASIDLIIEAGGTLTNAWKSYPWPGEAAVHIGIVNWVMGPWEGVKKLEGQVVSAISPSLTASIDVTAAGPLAANMNLCFMGVTPGNDGFVLSHEQREGILAADPGSKAVIKPFLIGRDVNRELDQGPTRFIIDFGALEKEDAEKYAGAMQHVRAEVYPVRKENRRETYAERWWRFVETRPNLRKAVATLDRVIVVPRVSPHLIVSRQDSTLCFDSQLMVVALDTPYHFGLLQSKVHAIWARARGSTLEERLRYTNTTIFETFPFPLQAKGVYDPRTPPDTAAARGVAKAALAFDTLRKQSCREKQLGLTKIHNQLEAGELPELQAAYEALNDAVCETYGLPAGTWRDESAILKHLVELNHRAAASGATQPGVTR